MGTPGADRRRWTRLRTAMTALVRPSGSRRPLLLRVINLGPEGALCRTRVPFRLGATFHAEILLDGKAVRSRPRVLRAYCRVVWTAVRVGPARPVQEVGLRFLEMDEADRTRLVDLLRSPVAA